MELDQYTVALLVRAEGAPRLDDKIAMEIQDAHMAHLAQLHDQGFLLAAGPFDVDPGERMRGLAIFKGTSEEVRRAADLDPAVRAGLLAYQPLSWMIPSGTVAFTRTRFPRSMDEVG